MLVGCFTVCDAVSAALDSIHHNTGFHTMSTERIPAEYEEFMAHAEATDAVVTRKGDMSEAIGWLYGRPNMLIATYHHDDATCEFHAI